MNQRNIRFIREDYIHPHCPTYCMQGASLYKQIAIVGGQCCRCETPATPTSHAAHACK